MVRQSDRRTPAWLELRVKTLAATLFLTPRVVIMYTHHGECVFEREIVARVGDVETEVIGQPLVPVIEGLDHEGVEDRGRADREHRIHNDERWPGGPRGREERVAASHEQVPKERE